MNRNSDINDSLNAKIIDISAHGDQDETLDQLKARLAKKAQKGPEAAGLEVIAKSLRATVSNYLRRRVRREQPLVKSLRQGQRLVLPVRKNRNA